MKKLIGATLLTVVSVAFDASAAIEIIDGVKWSYTVSNGKATITSGTTPCEGEMTVPDMLGGCLVTSIGDFAFSDCGELTSLTIPSSVTSIGSYAFYCCSGLTSLTIPSNVMSIGSLAFYRCSGLTSVMIPSSVTTIGAEAFVGCSGLTCFRVALDNPSYASVGGMLCSKDGKLLISGVNEGSVVIPSGVADIGSRAFYACDGLSSVTIPSSVTRIGGSAFEYCGGLKVFSVDSANPVYSSWNGLLCSKDGLVLLRGVNGDVTIPENVKSIGDSAFGNCSGLTSVTIPEGVTNIGWGAFGGCKRLKSVVMPMCMTSIGNSAFSGCESLLSMTIPSGVSVVEGHVFSFCSSLESVSIPEGVSNIENSAFAHCKNLRSLSIPNGVVRIGHYAFQDCSGLISLSIPESVSEVNSGAFSGCENLGWVEIDPANTYLRVKRGKVVTSSGLLIHDCSLLVRVLSSQIRINDPTILDVSYRIRSRKPTVKVCVLAFEDGQRSFAKVVRPETFIDGTGANVGDAVTPNVEHTISWKVSSDWQTKLAKVKFEVLASEGELLPLETMTIPASQQYGKMKISWNAISDSQVFDALLWLYADKDPGLTLVDGVLKNGSVMLAKEGKVSSRSEYYIYWDYNVNAATYVIAKMGYTLLTGAPLTYANQETRLGLSPSGARQYGYKIVE